MVKNTQLKIIFLFQIMSKFKRTEIIKFPSQSNNEDGDKLYWSQLSEAVTIQEYGAVRTVDVNPVDSNIIAATTHSKVQLYNVATLEVSKSLSKFKDTAFSGKFRHDGGLLCAGTGEGAVKVFDVNSKALLRVMSGESLESLFVLSSQKHHHGSLAMVTVKAEVEKNVSRCGASFNNLHLNQDSDIRPFLFTNFT